MPRLARQRGGFTRYPGFDGGFQGGNLVEVVQLVDFALDDEGQHHLADHRAELEDGARANDVDVAVLPVGDGQLLTRHRVRLRVAGQLDQRTQERVFDAPHFVRS